MMRLLLIGLMILQAGFLPGQCQLVPDFSVANSACNDQNIFVQNLTTGSNTYEWDFCGGDLNLQPLATITAANELLFRTRAIRIARNSMNNWVGFTIDQATNKFIRLDFGLSLSNSPEVLDLGNPSGKLNGAFDFQLYYEGGLWFAMIANTGSNNLLRFDLGSDLLASNPPVQDLGSFGVLNSPNSIKIVNDNGSLSAFIAIGGISEIVRLDFGTSILGSPVVNTFLVPGGSGLRGIDIIHECDRWFGLVTSYDNGGVFWLDFLNGLRQPPQTGLISFFTSFSYPASVTLSIDAGQYFAFIQSAIGPLYRLEFGTSIIDKSGSGTDLGDFSISNENFANCLQRDGSDWFGFSIDLTNRRLVRFTFPASCSSSVASFSGQNPPVIKYNSPGSFIISLMATSPDGYSKTVSRSIAVSATESPDIDFTTDGKICAGNPVNFNSTNSSGNIVGYDWDFGDLTSHGTGSSISHSFIVGNNDIKLTVTASNGCINSVIKPLTTYTAPVAEFDLPTPSLVCTNQQYLFVNTSSFDPMSNPTWQWIVNDDSVSTSIDLSQSLSSVGSQPVQLIASIPGCSSQSTKDINVQQIGPIVDYSVGSGCANAPLQFVNNTAGGGVAFSWSFGDGNLSNQFSPTNTYLASGTFLTTLIAASPNGCLNSIGKAVTIYSKPAPTFSVGLPPFSCSNSITPFQNNTPPLTDSNITNWSWQFNDAAGGTSTLQNPSYTFNASADFNVSLTATSDKGCSASTTRGVTISASPSADFMAGPSCLNQPTAFTDLSSGAVSRLWQIGVSTFSTANPSYTFVTSGNFPVTLSVTGSNACSSVKMKNIIVPVLPVLDYSVSSPCAGQNATFTDVTSSPQDAIVGWNWNFDGDAVTGNPAEYNFSPSGVFNVKMTTTHASGCRYTLSRNVQINPSPLASFTASPDRGASPLIVQFASTPQPGTSYSWKFLDKSVSTSTLASPVHTFLALGDYSAELTVTNGLGCSDVRSMPIHVLIPSIDLIMKDYSLVSDPVTGKMKSSVTILNNSNIPVNAAEIALSLSEKAVVNETVSLNLDPGQTAVRTLSFTLSPDQFEFTFLCAEVLSEKDVQADNNKRCINLASEDYFISPYPNPSSGQVHMDWIAPRAGDPALIIIYDSMGKKSYEWQTISEAGLNQTIHDLTYLAAGMYYVIIETVGLRKTTRFLRQ